MRKKPNYENKYPNGNGNYPTLGNGELKLIIDDERETKEEKVPSFPLYVTGKVDEHKRYEIINRLVRELYDEYKVELENSTSEARELYETFSSIFETKIGARDGWDRMVRENISKIVDKGKTWGDPVKQRWEINKLFYILLGSQIAEFFFAFSNAGMAIKDYYDDLSSNKPWFRVVVTLLCLQATLSTYINWNGIDRVKASKGKIGPILRIGEKVVIGTTEEDYDEDKHTHVDFEFDIDPRFRPVKKQADSNGKTEYVKRENYNAITVKFFINGIKLWYKSQQNFYEYKSLGGITKFLNSISFGWTNYFGASINAYIILKLLDGWSSDIGKLAIGAPSLLSLMYVGNHYYEEFTGEGVRKAVKGFWTSEDPLTQTGMISGWQRLEVETQWFLNGLARGTSIALGVYLVMELVAKFLKPLFEIPGMIVYAIPIISFFMAVINTLLSRKKGAKKYLEPFEITGPTELDTFIVPNEKLFDFLPKAQQPKVTRSEIFKKILPWAIAYGLTFAVPTWIVLSGGTSFAVLDILISLGVFGIKSLFTNFAETRHTQHVKVRAAIDAVIASKAKEIKPDRNGNEKLTDENTAWFNWIGNLIEQGSRIFMRAGTWAGVQEEYGLPSIGHWQDRVALNVGFVSPAISEFDFYKRETAPVITSGFNSVRESAGTPRSEIKGCGISNFTSRQLVCFLPCIFVKDKPVTGISDQTWTQWFSGFWEYEREVKNTRPVEEAPDSENLKEEKYRIPQRDESENLKEEKYRLPERESENLKEEKYRAPRRTERERGCCACISRLFSTRRSTRTVNDASYAESLLDVNSRGDSTYSNGGSRAESKYAMN